MDEIESYLSTRKAAELLGVSLRTVQLWVENGTLVAWKTAGGHRRIVMNSVYKILKHRKDTISKQKSDSGLVIVVIEDDKDVRDAYCLSITMTGLPIKVITAENGFEGLMQIGRHQPDIIMTDLMMPNMDGFEMLNVIGKDDGMKNTEIVIVSALDKEQVLKKGVAIDNVTYFQKPLKFENMETFLNAKLKSKGIV